MYVLLQSKLLLLLLFEESQSLDKSHLKSYSKRMWIRKIFLKHQQKGLSNVLIKDLRLHDHEYFFKSFPIQLLSSHCPPGLDHKSESLHYVAKL